MTLGPTEIITLGAVAVAIIAVVIYNQKAAALRRAREAAAQEERPAADAFLCQFVHHEGHVVGEAVAVEDDRLILKQAGVFKAVPLHMAKPVDGEVRLEGDVDWDAAVAAGTRWHEEHTSGHDPSVTEQLTRSEDVRAPALAAFQERHGGPASDEEEGDEPVDEAPLGGGVPGAGAAPEEEAPEEKAPEEAAGTAAEAPRGADAPGSEEE